ncbi:MAG TPA: outer membrane lipoprotein carrier protein LolA [Rubrivivax sp.]|nr:outer membrane lipoprotein carrier protein LolA [Pseudomonadota bacterium]HOL36282.1 outer membrane lipoprotein carrier protein LolA [Rubrivivax sp.]HPP83158.1 outer membrane lipoprotein carrier protein LolA [Rubrivivax sp.]
MLVALALVALAALAVLAPPTARAQAQGRAQAQAPAQAPARSGSFDLPALMALLARRGSGEARFSEERFVSGFDAPLHASGTLSFTAPDRFARHTLEPRPESMEVAGNLLTLERGGRRRQMALDTMPELAALLDALRGTLAGDGTLLERDFDVRVGGTAALWTLTLTPRDAQLAGQVRSLQFAGQGAQLRTVELLLAGGDRSLMVIEPLPPAAPAPAGGSAAPAPRPRGQR